MHKWFDLAIETAQAAGQEILKYYWQGKVLDWHTGLPLCYGKPNRRNLLLLALRAPTCATNFN